MKYFVVRYEGTFGFIKPWTAVRDSGGGETYSQQFLTPSIIEGIRQKLEVAEIIRHKLQYSGISLQQEVIKAKALEGSRKKGFTRNQSIIMRGVLVNPVLYLAFRDNSDAERAAKQHICLCRNEDILLPSPEILPMEESYFNSEINGYELRFTNLPDSFVVGYNRFKDGEEMKGVLEITGNPINE